MLGEAAALLAALSWAAAAILYKRALLRVEPLPANLIRSFFGTVFMVALYLAIRGANFSISLMPFSYILLGGIVGLGLGDLFFLGSLKYAGVARAVPVASTYPFFTILLSAGILREMVGISMISGTALIVLGIWLLHEDNGEKSHKFGILLALGTAITWAAAIAMTALGLRHVDPLLATVVRLPFVVALLLLATSLSGYEFHYERNSYILLGVAGALALGIGGFLFLYSISEIQTIKATSLSSTTPLFSTLLAIIFLKERVTIRIFTGILSIFFGIWIL
jgi:DME family drug/metabolite transporter